MIAFDSIGLPWPWIVGISLALAAGSASYLVLERVADLGWRIYRGRGVSRHAVQTIDVFHRHGSLGLKLYAPYAIALPIAAYLAPRSPLLAAWFVVLGLALYRYVTWRSNRDRLGDITKELEKLVTVLHSAYLVRPVVAPALEEAAHNVQGTLREVVDRTLRAVWIGESPREAYGALGKALNNPYLAQLGLILERAEECDPGTVGLALKELSVRLRRRRRLQAKVKASVSMLSGTVRFLQGANAVAVGVVLATPQLLDFYLASFSRQMMFALALAAVLGTSLYFDQQLSSLKERAL